MDCGPPGSSVHGIFQARVLEWGAIAFSGKNEGMEPKRKQCPVVDVTGDRSKIQCCKAQYCIGTWKVRSMNQGKLEVVKQEMARVKIDILGISELKWTGMGEFNSERNHLLKEGKVSEEKRRSRGK